jgi:hypothetical protein
MSPMRQMGDYRMPAPGSVVWLTPWKLVPIGDGRREWMRVGEPVGPAAWYGDFYQEGPIIEADE